MTKEDLFAPLPKKKYQVIYADPPWNYNVGSKFLKREMHNGVVRTSSAEDHYDTVFTKDLYHLDVQSIADDRECVLFMWTSSPHLAEAINLGKAWGFEYKTVGFVWVKKKEGKPQINPGYYTMSAVEICLIFKRGRIPRPRGARNVRQLLEAPRGEHSVKPSEIRGRIVEMFPEQEKIELFSRGTYPGWDVWGNEVPE